MIAAFAIAHISNHIMMFAGVGQHIAVMNALRLVYRNPIVEAVLLGAILFQMTSGAILLWKGRHSRTSAIGRLQAASGALLLLFLAIHVSAVLTGRASGVDTNIYFAVAGYYAGMAWFFVPYYFIAVAALFTHIGCAFYWILNEGNNAVRVFCVMTVAGVVLAAALTVTMAGWINPIAVPESYLAEIPQ